MSKWCVCLLYAVCLYNTMYRESKTWPISINTVSAEERELGLTRGTCCMIRRLEVVAVAVHYNSTSKEVNEARLPVHAVGRVRSK